MNLPARRRVQTRHGGMWAEARRRSSSALTRPSPPISANWMCCATTPGNCRGDYRYRHGAKPETWQKIIGVNFVCVMLFTRLRCPSDQAQGGGVKKGHPSTPASVAGIRSGAGGNAYSASKAGVITSHEPRPCEPWSVFKYSGNAVCPGLIETGMTKPVI